MHREIKVFFTALTFLTRIPIPWDYGWDPRWLQECCRWFPAVGLLVGMLGSFVFWVCSCFLPFEPALVISMLATIRITGAFHEDGFADTCDGFGGGLSREKVLTIMKDSRLGTYGTTGLLGMLALKFFSLQSLSPSTLLWALPLAHGWSRVIPVLFMASCPYVRDEDESKSKPLVQSVSGKNLAWVVLWGMGFLLALVLCSGQGALLFLQILFGAAVFLAFRQMAMGKIGGYTGDVLGALQQLCEVVFYLVVLTQLSPG